MYDLILASIIFHTLSSLTLLAGCGIAAFVRAPRRATSHVWVDQMEMDADAILSTPVAAPAERGYSPAHADAQTVAVA
jgi:hypothetical protein